MHYFQPKPHFLPTSTIRSRNRVYHSEKQNGSVIEVIFNAHDITIPSKEDILSLRFVHYINNANKEKRIPSLASLFKEHNVEIGDIICLESRIIDGDITYYLKFYKKNQIRIIPNSIFFSTIESEDKKESIKTNIEEGPLQQIFYGAPGTGKSFKIDDIIKAGKYKSVRTTFHPDSDYSTFVGAYKPVMEDVDVHVLPVMFNINNSGFGFDKNNGTFKEKRIAYKFVKQAFLKSYLGAWKKYAEQTILQVSVDAGNGEKWILKSVDDSRVDAQKESLIEIKKFEAQVKDFWNKPSKDVGNQEHWRATACKWYENNNSEVQNPTADDCWIAIESALNAGDTISETPVKSQTYFIQKGKDGFIVINNDNQRANKNTIEDSYINIEESKNSFSIQASIARLLHEYSDDFVEAWDELKKRVNKKIIAPQFLIIEEINRGNCAQIFGDLFQLLDRSVNGFSTYPIEADSDIRDEVARAFREDEEYKLLSKINIEGVVKNYTSNYDKTLSEDVQEGRVLLLPPNLYIWATMNTSDQSLFPIDSAFKRRWDWVYIPIKDHEDENYKIDIDSIIYDWWGFLEKINLVIGETTSSEDKKMGYFFVKPKDKVIKADKFVSKVLFYLWNDVFNNYGFDHAIFSRGENKKFTFSDFFKKDGKPDTNIVNEFLKKLDETIDKEHSFKCIQGSDGATSSLIVKYQGENIEGETAVKKYIEIVKRVINEKGVEQVINCIGADLTKTPPEDTTRKFILIDNTEWYLATNIGIGAMKKNLNKIRESLGVEIEIIEE